MTPLSSIDLKAIYKTHQEQLLGFLGHMVGLTAAEDLAQETYERVLKNLHSFRSEASVKTWVFKIAKNLAIDYLRKKARDLRNCSPASAVSEKELETSHGFEDIIDERSWNLPLEAEYRREMVACIAQFIDQLQPHIKTLILLREIDCFSISDIAEIFDLTVENVRVKIFRSREILRKALSKGCHLYQGRDGGVLCDKK